MSATKGNIGDKSLAEQHIKQQQLYKLRVLLFGCRKDWPKKAQSAYSLASTSKSSQVVDVSSRHLVASRSDIARLPAGGSLPCGCPTIPASLALVTESTQTMSTRDMCTQTQDTEHKSNADASPPSVASTSKDEATQPSVSDSPSPPTKVFLQVEYENVSKKFREPAKVVKAEDEASISSKWSFKSPVIVVNRNLAGLSVNSSRDFRGDVKRKKTPVKAPPKDNKAQAKNQSPPERPGTFESKEQEFKGDVRKEQEFKGDFRKEQQVKGDVRKEQPVKGDFRKDHEFDDGVRRRSFMVVVPPKDDKQTQTENQEQETKVERKSSIAEAPLWITVDKQTQYENQWPQEEEPAPLACSRIPELLKRVCDLESKLRNQEQSLRSLQGSMKSLRSQETKPSDCTLLFQAQPRKELPCKPTCVDQSTQKTDEDDAGCRTPSKEFIKIFIKSAPPSQNEISCCANTQNNIPKQISQCPLKNKCEENKIKSPVSAQCLEDADVPKTISQCPLKNKCEENKIQRQVSAQCLKDADNLQQFNRMFAKPNSQELICRMNKSEKSVSCFANPTVQCLKEPETETENLLDKFVELVATKPRDEDSSACGLAKNKSNESMKKEVYESMLQQFIQYFTKPKTECEEKTSAPKNEGEHYSFERLCAELVNLFSKPKTLEVSPVKEEDKLKRVTISTTNTVLGEDPKAVCQESIGKQEVKSISMTFQTNEQDEESRKSDISNCSNSQDMNLPVLKSLVDELIYLIGPRAFKDVVLTIVRQDTNVYHINIREMATGNVVGSLRANGAAINEAINLGVFEDIHTFCELGSHRAKDPRDCPLGTNLDVAVLDREHGGETQLACRDGSKEKTIEFATRVLGLQPGEAGRFFSLTNALKLARKSSDQELSKVSQRTGLIGRGAVTGNLVFLGSVDDMPVTRLSQADLSELGEASRHFLRILSGEEHEEDKA